MANHPFITETPLRVKLRAQLARLERVIVESDQPWRVAEAERHARTLTRWIECETDFALTLKPIDHFGLKVDDICRQVERVAAFDGEPVSPAEADKLRALQPARKTLGLRFAA